MAASTAYHFSKRSVPLLFFALALIGFLQPLTALGQDLPWQTGAGQPPVASAPPQPAGMHSIGGVPLYIDGTQSATHPALLAPALLDQVKLVTTLGSALAILGPAYIAPDDTLHIPHWRFQNGTMLTLWPQGGENLNDAVSVAPRPDCGVPAPQCNDLVLGRKAGGSSQGQSQHGNKGSSGSSSSGMPSASSLMKLIH